MTNTPKNRHQFSLLKFSGADASRFLQGQLSNDINDLDCKWQFSGYCNPKGRLLALLQLWKHNEAIYALIPSSIAEATAKRLRMYVMRSKVVIHITDDIAFSSIESRTTPHFHLSIEGTRHTLGFGGRELIIDIDTHNPSNSLPEEWVRHTIASGIPTISDLTMELFVPQMVNLDLLDGINFKKGCYTGQEIVARMHYLGKLKQRMYVCTVNTLDKIGQQQNCDYSSESLYQAGNKVIMDNKTVGHIVNSSGDQALAVLRIEVTDKHNATNLTVESNNGKTLDLSVNDVQPYSIELKS